MYPFIELFGIKLYMTGLGIISAVLSFLYLIRFYSKRYDVNFWRFFNWIPIFLIIPYILGSYVYYVLQYFTIDGIKSFFPIGKDFLIMISPYGYNFSFIGVSLGLFISIVLFLYNINLKSEFYKRIDVFFYSIALSLIPLGIFFTLGDTFVGKFVDTYSDGSVGNFLFTVSALTDQSDMYDVGNFYAVGMFLSFVGLASFLITLFHNYIFKKYGFGMLGFIIILLLLNIVFGFQAYTKHLPLKLGSLQVDIKNYWTIILSAFIILYHHFMKIKYR